MCGAALVNIHASRFYELHVEGDGYLVADQNASGFKRRIPCKAEVLAADLRRRRYRHPGIAPGILRGRSRSFNSEDHLAGDAMNGQIAFDGRFSIPVQVGPSWT